MDDIVVVAGSPELVDVSPCEGTASKGTTLIQHRSNLLCPVGHDVIAFASVGQHLLVQVTSQHVDVAVVEADRVRGTTEFEFRDKRQAVSLEIELVDVRGFQT